MSAFYSMGEIPGVATVYPLPTSRGRQYSNEGGFVSAARLTTDPIGTFTLTLTNVVVGSSTQVETQDGVTVYFNRTAISATEVFVLSAYSLGSPGNNLRIKVRKGTASPFYRPWETLATAVVGNASIYVAQIPDE